MADKRSIVFPAQSLAGPTGTSAHAPFSEPAGFTQVLAKDFTVAPSATEDSEGWRSQNAGTGIVQITNEFAAPVSPPNAYRWVYPVGFASGGAPGNCFVHGDPALSHLPLTAAGSGLRLYLRLVFRLSPNWQPNVSTVNKLGYLWTNNPPGATANPAVYLNARGSSTPLIMSVNLQTSTDSQILQGTGAAATVVLGLWHVFEAVFGLNTGTNNDGTVDAWLNGTKIITSTSVGLCPGTKQFRACYELHAGPAS